MNDWIFDYRLTTGGRALGLREQLMAVRDIESDSQFALESHLEEFIDQNWERINVGQLLRYVSWGKEHVAEPGQNKPAVMRVPQ